MTTTDQESAQKVAEQAPPSAPPSQPAGDSTSSSSQANSAQAPLSPELASFIEETVNKALQSMKDRRIQKHENRLTKVEETLAKLRQYQELGMTEAQAIDRIKLDERLAELEGVAQTASSQPAQGSAAVDLSALTASIAQGLGLDTSADDVKAFMATLADTDPATVAAKMAKFAAERAQKPQPSAADAAPQQGQTPPQEDLRAQYAKELADIRRGDVAALANLKIKYRKLGLEVY